jgi:hypothetical protein
MRTLVELLIWAPIVVAIVTMVLGVLVGLNEQIRACETWEEMAIKGFVCWLSVSLLVLILRDEKRRD